MAIEHGREAALVEARERMRACRRCPDLVAARTQVVCGEGGPGALVLLVCDAPRSREDAEGTPLAGRARQLLDRLLLEAGCPPEARFLTTLTRCLPPLARAPTAAEVSACATYLETEIDHVAPVVVVALGGLVAGVLRGRPSPIRGVRGQEEGCRLGEQPVWLLPVFHPAAALYDPAAITTLGADLARIPALLARGRPVLEAEPDPEPPAPPTLTGPGQLGLF